MTGRRARGDAPPAPVLDPFMGAVADWLDSPEALGYAKSLLRRVQLQGDGLAQELIDTVRTNIWLRLADGPLDDGTPAAAYCKRSMWNLAEDLRRGFKHQSRDAGRLREHDADLSGTGDRRVERAEQAAQERAEEQERLRSRRAAESVDHGLLDTLRARIEASGQPPVVVSGALTYLTTETYDDCDLTGVPRPKSGANKAQARLWPALWFAGRRDGIFPKERASAAQRQRLKRAGTPIEQLLTAMKEWLRRDLEAGTHREGDPA